MNVFIIANIIGFVILIVNYIGNMQKTNTRILIWNSIINLLCAIQYLLLSGYTGAICCSLCIIRNIFFSNKEKRPTIWILLIFSALVIGLNFKFIHQPIDIVPIFNIVFYATLLWLRNVKNIKKGLFVIGTFGIVYDIAYGAYSSILTNLTDTIFGLVHIFKSSDRN